MKAIGSNQYVWYIELGVCIWMASYASVLSAEAEAPLQGKIQTDGNSGQYLSSYASQLEFNRLDTERTKIENDLRLISETEVKIKRIQADGQNIDIVSIAPQIERSLASLKATVTALATWTNSQELSLDQSEVSELVAEYQNFRRIQPTALRKMRSDLGRFSDSDFNIRSSPLNSLIQDIASSVSRESDSRDDENNSNPLPKTFALYLELRSRFNEQKIAYSKIAKLSTDSAAELHNKSGSNIASEFGFETEKKELLSYAEKLASAFSEARKTREIRFKEIEKRMAWLDTQMRQSQTSQYAINDKLVWTIYAVITAVLILFALLRVLPQDLAKSMIETRILFETVSLVFLMVTLIILGIGDKIKTETLGTLLGTIAGYIFGRQLSQKP